jgi:hypothetical protein
VGFVFRTFDVIRRASVLQSVNLSLLSAAHSLDSEMQDDIDENALFCDTQWNHSTSESMTLNGDDASVDNGP